MISLEYVNGTTLTTMTLEDLSRPYFTVCEFATDAIDSAFASLDVLNDRLETEQLIFGESAASTEEMFVTESENFFETVGKAIEKVFESLNKFIDNIIDKIKSIGFAKKSKYEKLDVLLKEHPRFEKEIVAAFNNNDLDLSDVKSLKELNSAYEEIMEMSKKANIDPKTLKGKWEKAKMAFEKDEKSWKITKIAAATTGVITAALAVKTFKSKCLNATTSAAKDRDYLAKEKAKIYEELKELESKKKLKDTRKKELFRMKLRIWQELNGKHMAAIGESYSFLDRLATGMANLADTISTTDKKKTRFEKNMEGVSAREEKELRAKGRAKALADDEEEKTKKEIKKSNNNGNGNGNP